MASQSSQIDVRTGVAPPKPDDISELDKLQKSLEKPFSCLKRLVRESNAPVSYETGDGSKLSSEDKKTLYQRVETDLQDMAHLGISDVRTLIKIMSNKISGELVDDKTYLMEGMVRTAAKLPEGSKNRTTLTNQFLTQLWNDLKHPPISYLGEKFQYRAADGSNNSLVHPQLGAAGTPYSRTVKPTTMQTPALPDPGVVFDSIMTRKHSELHPNRISSVLFYFASIIIHDLFRTDHRDYTNSLTSSYLDLSPLYGSNQEEQNQMRMFVSGKLKPDCFSEARLLFFPPGVGCLLIMFNRFHNNVVDNLARINEGNRFSRPTAPIDSQDQKKAEEYKAKLAKYDDDLFQTGRLITCGLYVNIVLIDYVRTILNLNRTDSNWQLDPRAEMKDVPLGVGNQVSAEFNLVYRWHSTLSNRDERWTKQVWEDLFGKDCDPKSVQGQDFIMKMSEVMRKTDKDPSKRPFAGIKRNVDGTLPDDPIVDILVSSIEDCANSFGPNRVPEVMRAIEVLGIEQSRAWNLCSLNEFRKYFGLEPHRSFADITSDKYVADQLKHLYDHPDKVEIYPGIVVEDAKQPMCPGSGLAPPYTVSRAVLSDAVALVRGDRFYTVDYNPRTLTNWGFRTVESDTNVDNGCVFYKLFLNAFPQHFKKSSVYAHYPLTTPEAMHEALVDLNKDHLYNFDQPARRQFPHVIKSYKAAMEVLESQDLFKVIPGRVLSDLRNISNKEYNTSIQAEDALHALRDALYTDGYEEQIRTFYATKTRELLFKNSHKIALFNQCDIVRDVGNHVPLHFVSELFMLPLKTEQRPRGIFTEADLHITLAAISALEFSDADAAQAFGLQAKSRDAVQTLGKLVHANVDAIAHTGLLSSIMHVIWGHTDEHGIKNYGESTIKQLLASGANHEHLIWKLILGTASGIVAKQGQIFAQVMEYFLVKDGKAHWARIQELAAQDTEDSFENLSRYVLEASRLSVETGVLREAVQDITLSDSKHANCIKKGERVFINLHTASRDPSIFPDPENLDITRPLDSYIHLVSGPHENLDAPLTRIALTAMLKEVAKLKGLRTSRGPQGSLHKVMVKGRKTGEEYCAYLTEMWDRIWMYPCAFKVNWDD